MNVPRARWEPVWGGSSEAEAEIVAGRLSTSGLRTRVLGSQGTPYPGMVNLSGWTVLVRESEAGRARDMLEARGEGANLLSAGGDVTAQNFRDLVRITCFSGMVGLAVLFLWLISRAV